MRIYLAGKIGKRDWRESILGDYWRIAGDPEADWGSGWPVAKAAIFGQHDYVGPFFVGDDHGCAHGPGSHGVAANEDSENRSCIECSVELPPDRRAVADRCFAAIDACDFVFAWLNDHSAFGTLVEIGYAVASRKPVVAASPHGFDREGDLWFARSASVTQVTSDTPRTALEISLASPNLLARLSSAERRDWYEIAAVTCESPIERKMLDALAPHFPGVLDGSVVGDAGCLELQYQAVGYRLDFAIIGDRKVAVECDGHDFHDRTKEQAARDKSRDRRLIADGWTVLRYTGSEIHKDAAKCAAEAIAIAMSGEAD
jgi:hypothetical protein